MDRDRGAVSIAMSISLSMGSVEFGDILRNWAAAAQGKILAFSQTKPQSKDDGSSPCRKNTVGSSS
jgi:hypothetical protein